MLFVTQIAKVHKTRNKLKHLNRNGKRYVKGGLGNNKVLSFYACCEIKNSIFT